MSILKLFCHVDDFCQWLVTWENAKLLGVTRKRGPALRLLRYIIPFFFPSAPLQCMVGPNVWTTS